MDAVSVKLWFSCSQLGLIPTSTEPSSDSFPVLTPLPEPERSQVIKELANSLIPLFLPPRLASFRSASLVSVINFTVVNFLLPFYPRSLYMTSCLFLGGATGALSSAVIALEMTGQLTHLLPTLVAVIISNLVARRLGPSIYETLIALKKLPHLPTMIQKSSAAHKVLVQDFMDREILYVWPNCTYRFLKHLLDNNLHWNEFPYLKSPESMIFLGTISRSEIEFILSKYLNHRRRTEIAKSRIGKQSNPLTSKPNNNNNENNNEPDGKRVSYDEVRKNPLVVSSKMFIAYF